MRLLDYLALLRQRLLLVMVIVGVVAGASFALSITQTPAYEAALRLQVRPPAPGTQANDVLANSGFQSDMGTEAELLRSTDVLNLAARKLGQPEAPPGLADAISVVPIADAVLLVKSRAGDPDEAMLLVNTVVDAYLEIRREGARTLLENTRQKLSLEQQTIQQRLSAADAAVRNLPPGSVQAVEAEAERNNALADLVLSREQVRQLADLSALDQGFGQVLEPANRAAALKDLSPARSLVFGIMLGLPLAIAAVLLLDSLSDTVRDKEDAEGLTGSEVLGMIPADPDIDDRGDIPVTDDDPFSVVAEAYRTASVNITRAADAVGARRIMITSPVDGEGKTTTVVNLAIAQAERGLDTLLVETDLRRPRTHVMLEAKRRPGITDVISGEVRAPRAVQQVRERLGVVAAGRPTERPDALLASADLEALFDALVPAPRPRRNAEGKVARTKAPDTRILFDGAPMLQAAESSAVAAAADGVVLVVRAGVTHSKAATRAAEQIRRAGGNLLGVMLIGVTSPSEMGFGGAEGTYKRVIRRGHRAPDDQWDDDVDGDVDAYDDAEDVDAYDDDADLDAE